MELERAGLDGNSGKPAERMVVKSANRSRNDSDLCLRQPTEKSSPVRTRSRHFSRICAAIRPLCWMLPILMGMKPPSAAFRRHRAYDDGSHLSRFWPATRAGGICGGGCRGGRTGLGRPAFALLWHNSCARGGFLREMQQKRWGKKPIYAA